MSVSEGAEALNATVVPPIGNFGKYQLLELLGGGMSHVFRARDTVLGREVVVKILTSDGCAHPDTKARFLAEARVASNLVHDNILGIYDFGEDELHRPFMVMEFLRGRDLHTAICNGELTNLQGKLRIALQAARALEYVHSQNVIHRDVKPENLFIASNGVVKLMDFGISKQEGQVNMTAPGFVLGTPFYMAPEQVKGLKLTGQVDVYAFGVLLFELFTGRKPVGGETLEEIFYTILNQPLDLGPMAAAEAPQALRDLVAHCTAKDAAERPLGFAPIVAALEAALKAEIAPPAAPAPVQQKQAAHPLNRRILAAAAASVLAGAGTLGWLAWSGYRPLQAKVRASAAAISAAGIGADGLVRPQALVDFDNLRGELETLDRYRRQGAPLGYRLGTLLWGDLYRPTERLYFDRFRQFFLTPALDRAAGFLRGLPARPGPSYAEVYETLKAYLMATSQSTRSDAESLTPALVRSWGYGSNVDEGRQAAAARQFGFYATDLAHDRALAMPSDTEAIAHAREYLKQFTTEDRVYSLLLADANRRFSVIDFNGQFPGSDQTLTETYQVPGAFTKAGWDFMNETVARPEAWPASDSWVTGGDSSAQNRPHAAGELATRYRADFVKAWRQYLQSATLVPFGGAADAARKLKLLAGEDSPLDRWLAVAAANTHVDAAAVAGVFQPLAAAEAGGVGYRETLGALIPASGGTGPAAAEQALAAVKRIEATFHQDAGNEVGKLVARVMEEPIHAASNLRQADAPPSATAQ
jgi:tRNA A-37 threonylcarbamoyl transferase component Bud32